MCIVTEMDSRKAACSCTGSVLNVRRLENALWSFVFLSRHSLRKVDANKKKAFKCVCLFDVYSVSVICFS